jgi:hypothetical protein
MALESRQPASPGDRSPHSIAGFAFFFFAARYGR